MLGRAKLGSTGLFQLAVVAPVLENMNVKSLFASLLTSLACLSVGCASAASEADLAAEAAGVAYDVERLPTPSLNSPVALLLSPGAEIAIVCPSSDMSRASASTLQADLERQREIHRLP